MQIRLDDGWSGDISSDAAGDIPGEWFLLSENGDTLGPYSYWDLYAWYVQEEIAGDQLVAGPGMEEWEEIGRVVEAEVESVDMFEDPHEDEAREDIELKGEAEVYVLGPEGNTLGPYAYRDIVYWFQAGELDGDSLISVSGQDWEVAATALSDEPYISEENLHESSGDKRPASEQGDVYVSVDDEIQDLIIRGYRVLVNRGHDR